MKAEAIHGMLSDMATTHCFSKKVTAPMSLHLQKVYCCHLASLLPLPTTKMHFLSHLESFVAAFLGLLDM